MTVKEIVEQIDRIVNMLAPFANIVGLEKYSTLATIGVDIIEKLVDNVESIQDVLSTEDEVFIRGKLAELRAVNDALAKRVENS